MNWFSYGFQFYRKFNFIIKWSFEMFDGSEAVAKS